MAAIYSINFGIPDHLKKVFGSMQIAEFVQLYKELSVSVSKVLDMIQEPPFQNAAESCTFGYLVQFIGSMNMDELSSFLRFVSGSPVCSPRKVSVIFCSVGEFARRPVSHTCTATLELPTSYNRYLEFSDEFWAVLQNEYTWIMDCI